jgi:very-long-chain enoyl-CoA reductase
MKTVTFKNKSFGVADDIALAELQQQIKKQFGISLPRQCIRTDSKVIIDNQDKLNSAQQIMVKDYGPQFSYRGVFIIEYLCPILAVYFWQFIYGSTVGHQVGIYAWYLHYLKREYETVMVHKFSRATMPLSNLYRNAGYYGLFGLLVGFNLIRQPYSFNFSPGWLFWILMQFFNLMVHRSLSSNTSRKTLPKYWAFKYVCCPNYFFEIMGWLTFSIITGAPFAYLFTLVGAYQMTVWAKQKKQRYLKNDLPVKYCIFPFIY